jgi:hypothetical protein
MDGPGVILYDENGIALAVLDSVTIPLNTSGLLLMGVDSGTARYLFVDSSGRASVVSDQLPAALVGGRLDTNVGAWFGSTAPTIGQKAMANSLPVAIASDQPALPIVAASLPLPTGAATEATLLGVKTGTDKIPASPSQEHVTAGSPHAARLTDGAAFYKATTPADTQPISAVSLPLPTGAATEVTLALIKAKTDNLDVALSTRAVTGLTDTELRATPVPVSGPLTDAQLRATPVLVSNGGDRDPNNSTDTPLASFADFTGAYTDCSTDASIYVHMLQEAPVIQDCLLQVYWANDAIGTDEQLGDQQYYINQLEGWKRYQFHVQAPFYKIKLTNNGDPQTVLHLASYPTANLTDLSIGPGETIEVAALFTGNSVISHRQNVVSGRLSGGGAMPVQVDDSGVLRIDPSGSTTQPISGTVTAGISNWLGSTAPNVGQKIMDSSLPVVIASDQGALTVLVSPNAETNVQTLGALDDNCTIDIFGPTILFIAGGSGGNLVGTLVAEFTVDGFEWFPTRFREYLTGVTHSSLSGTFNTDVAYAIDLPDATPVARVRVSAYTSGSTTVEARSSSAPLQPIVQPVMDNGGSLTIDSTQLPAALVGGRLDENVGAWLGSTAPTVGQKTMANSLPVVLASDQYAVVDTNNSTTATLGAIGAFVGTATDVLGYASIIVETYSDKASAPLAYLQFSTDGVNWDVSIDMGIIPASTQRTYIVSPRARYFRVNYTNGASIQTFFRLQTILSRQEVASSATVVGNGVRVATAVGGLDSSGNLQAATVYDLDSGAGTEPAFGVVLRRTGVGGSVEIGNSGNPIRVDPTGTTSQPFSAPNVVEINNTTAILLGANAVFTGTARDILNYNAVSVEVFADQNSATDGLQIQFSKDGTNWDKTTSFTVTASTGQTHTFAALSQYFRLKYTNGAIAQGTFRLTALLHPLSVGPEVIRVKDTVDAQADATVVKAVAVGKFSSTSYIDVKVESDGALPITDNAGSLTVDSPQLPLALVGGRLDANIGSWLGSTAPTVGSASRWVGSSVSGIPVVPQSDYEIATGFLGIVGSTLSLNLYPNGISSVSVHHWDPGGSIEDARLVTELLFQDSDGGGPAVWTATTFYDSATGTTASFWDTTSTAASRIIHIYGGAKAVRIRKTVVGTVGGANFVLMGSQTQVGHQHVNVDNTVAISAATLPLPTGAATNAILTGGTTKAIVRGGAKGATVAADVTSTAEGADHQALDVQIYHGGAAINPATIRALTNSDVVSSEVTQWIGSTAPTVGQKTMASSLPVVTASDQMPGGLTTTGTISAVDGTVSSVVYGTAGFNFETSSTFLGTIVAEVSIGGNVYTTNIIDTSTRQFLSHLDGSLNTTKFYEIVVPSGASSVQLRASAYVSGTASIRLRTSSAPATPTAQLSPMGFDSDDITRIATMRKYFGRWTLCVTDDKVVDVLEEQTLLLHEIKELLSRAVGGN